MEALSFGLNFRIYPKKRDRCHIEAEFENVHDQLTDLGPTSPENVSWLEAKLVDWLTNIKLRPFDRNVA